MLFARVLITLLAALLAVPPAALAQQPKSGGTLRIYQRDNPASASIHEEATYSTNIPFMSLFNNLILYKQDEPRNTEASIVPELATSWAWSEDHASLTFKLRDGVTWHDGKPFTSADVKCTFDLIQDRSKERFRKNPRKGWYHNLAEVVPNGPLAVTFRLNRPQPALTALLASGDTPIYPCHVSPAQMRTKPVGTGPFMLAEFSQNEMIRVVKNPRYWKPGRPYLDGIDFPIITNRSTAVLAFLAGKLDMTFPGEVTVPLLRDIKNEKPDSVCHYEPINGTLNLLLNREKPPFDNADVRRAMALTLDRKAFVDIMFEGKADIGAAMLPPPNGVWGMPEAMLRQLPGYNADTAANRAEARAIMAKLGYGPGNRLAITVATRNIPIYRDAAVILIDNLREIYIDGELDPVETSLWFAKIARKDYIVGMNATGNPVDDPDQVFYENYACKSERNYSGYCNPALEKLFDRQSGEVDVAKRQTLVWDIDRQIQEDVARPIILYIRGGTCWRPEVHGFTVMVNSSYNGYRFEDLWLDR